MVLHLITLFFPFLTFYSWAIGRTSLANTLPGHLPAQRQPRELVRWRARIREEEAPLVPEGEVGLSLLFMQLLHTQFFGGVIIIYFLHASIRFPIFFYYPFVSNFLDKKEDIWKRKDNSGSNFKGKYLPGGPIAV